MYDGLFGDCQTQGGDINFTSIPSTPKSDLYAPLINNFMSSQIDQNPLALHVVIVGCGISGLSAAYALGKAGHRITVVESAPLLTDIGAGIQVTPSVLSFDYVLHFAHSLL